MGMISMKAIKIVLCKVVIDILLSFKQWTSGIWTGKKSWPCFFTLSSDPKIVQT